MKFLNNLQSFHKSQILVLALFQVAVLGTIDYFTGFEFSFSLFYLMPVALAAWGGDKRVAISLSVISAVTWHLANDMAGQQFSNSLIPFWNSATRLGFFIIVSLLLDKLKESYRQESRMARTDYLTGAANPRSFYETAQTEIDRSIRYRHDLSIVYLDADNFKQVNDTLGHHVGSNVLVRVVEVVKQNLRASDTIARVGGDEFVILLPETNSQQSQAVINKLREKLQCEMDEKGWPVTFSIGVLSCAIPPATIDEMLKFADNLMYEVKRSGKNSVRFRELGRENNFEQQEAMAVLSRKMIFD
ncbi:MAG: GGDEF domain-containing protein [Pyrinomonadaceae bacterium]